MEADEPAPTEPPAAPDRRWFDLRTWPRWLKVCVLVAGLGGAGAAAWVSRDWVVARQEGPLKQMFSLVTAQEQYKQCCVVDMDGDGMGEYGWLGELAGTEACRGNGLRMNTSPFVALALGKKDAQGRARHLGLVFHLALPAPDRRWELEPGTLPKRGYPKDPVGYPYADLRETRWLCYAWPDEGSLDQRRTYFVSQGGNVWVTDAKVTPYRGAKGPRVSAAFPKEGQGPPTAEFAPEYVGADGNTWSFIAWR